MGASSSTFSQPWWNSSGLLSIWPSKAWRTTVFWLYQQQLKWLLILSSFDLTKFKMTTMLLVWAFSVFRSIEFIQTHSGFFHLSNKNSIMESLAIGNYILIETKKSLLNGLVICLVTLKSFYLFINDQGNQSLLYTL